ncbi:MAG: MBL fold metallo-hydrolase [Elusimicrobiota bacterium]
MLITLKVGSLATNCYILSDDSTRKCVIIDPGDESKRIIKKLKELGLVVEYIINTHGHPDHIFGDNDVKEFTSAKILAHKNDATMLELIDIKIDRFLEEDDVVETGKIKLKVIHTPGHTPGGICLLYDDILFTGDTLFCGTVGRTDLPGGSEEQIISSVKNKLMILPGKVKILPGHEDACTIEGEKLHNPYCR